ncbi:unnamed protein product [Ectocarpus sp. 4 AP-2014]
MHSTHVVCRCCAIPATRPSTGTAATFVVLRDAYGVHPLRRVHAPWKTLLVLPCLSECWLDQSCCRRRYRKPWTTAVPRDIMRRYTPSTVFPKPEHSTTTTIRVVSEKLPTK